AGKELRLRLMPLLTRLARLRDGLARRGLLLLGHDLHLEDVAYRRLSPGRFRVQRGQARHRGILDLRHRGDHVYVLDMGNVDILVDVDVLSLVFRDVVDDRVLLGEGARRAGDVAAGPARVVVAEVALPTVVAVALAIVGEIRVVASLADAVIEPG